MIAVNDIVIVCKGAYVGKIKEIKNYRQFGRTRYVVDVMGRDRKIRTETLDQNSIRTMQDIETDELLLIK